MARKNQHITIHTDFYYRRFVAKTCTFGYLFSVCITLLVIFMPFITTYSTGSKSALFTLITLFSLAFWSRVAESPETPLVEYTDKLYAELLFIDE